MKTAGSMTGGRASVEVAPPIIEPERRPVTVAPRVLKHRLIAADVLVVGLAISTGLRVAVAGAAGRSPRGPALAPRAGLHHVPGLDPVVLDAQALPSACGRAPDRGAAADRLRRPHRHRSGGRRLLRLPVQGAVAVLDPVDPGVRRHADGHRAHDRAEDVQQVATRRADGPAGADRRHRRRCRRPAARRPAHAAPRVSGRRLRRRRRHRDPWRMRGARADRAHRRRLGGHRRHRRADLPLIGGVGGRQPPDARPHG